jgi:anti-sigma factor RsiW
MECRRWEETGLLYSVQELSSKENNDYEEHLKECGECRSELYRYRQEHARFFTVENLGAVPSLKVDAEILRVCSDCRKSVVVKAPALFPAFFRKAFVPVALFIVGFISVGYIMLNVQNAGQAKVASAQHSTSANSAVTQAATIAATAANMRQQIAADSLKDSLKGNKVNYARTRGNLSGQGAIPVDLKDK